MEMQDGMEQTPADQPETTDSAVSRRGFLKTISVAGAGLAAGQIAEAQVKKPVAKPAPKPAAKPAAKPAPKPVQKPQPAKPKPPELKIAMIGPGNQGRNLLTQCLRIEGVRFVAVADIWDYSRKYASNILKAYDQPVRAYEDYREMLEKEKDLDAVIIATPDFVHAEQTIACLRAGKHVYCEKEMSNNIEDARQMVLEQRKSGKLLQIGHQRRSNPRYWKVDSLIHKDNLAGKVTHMYGQWNRSRKLDLGWPKDALMTDEALKRYGYDSMTRFRNWRWYKQFSGGPIADLGSHQIDIFNWIARSGPLSVQATGGADNYPDTEWYDNMLALYDYKAPWGIVRAFYQVINTSSYGGYYEVFMGDAASIEISENINKGSIYPEPVAKPREWVNEAKKIEKEGQIEILLTVGATLGAGGAAAKGQKLGAAAAEEKQPHLMHLENFFNAVRDPQKVKLSCPGEVGFETCVSVLRANEALAKGGKVTFDPKEFHV